MMYSDVGVNLASSPGSPAGKRARRVKGENFDDSHLALDAVDSNPHPTAPFVLPGGAESPRSSASLFLSSRANSSPPTFLAEQAAITETNHFFGKTAFHKPIPVDNAPSTNSPPQRMESHRDGLVRTLIAELQEERSKRLELQCELTRLKQLLREREVGDRLERSEYHSHPASNCLASLSAQPATFRTIPIVDLSLPLADVVFSAARACRQVGFFYVINHGVEASLISNVMSFSKRFFDLPSPVKEEVNSANSRSGTRGYFSLGGEDLNAKDGTRDLVAEGQTLGSDSTSTAFRGDWKEGYDCGREISPSDKEYSLSSIVDCNYWPQEDVLPGFRTAMLTYQRGALELAQKLLKVFAIGLGLPPDYFTSRTQKPMATLRLLHYPPQPKQNLSELDWIGCGAHTDYGLCTLLLQDSVGGLQVRNTTDEWVEAPPVPGSFVVNIGDMMSRWTNGKYASTVHRVVNLTGKERYSIPLFVNPDVCTIVNCLPTCLDEEEPPRFAPEASHEILSQRYRGSFVHMKAGKEN